MHATAVVLSAALVLSAAPFASGTKRMKGVPPAKIYEVSPNYGSIVGGTRVVIKGSGFERAGTDGTTTVWFGFQPCMVEHYYSNDHQIVCYAPPAYLHEDGDVSVRITVDTAVSTFDASCLGWCNFRYRDSVTPRVRGVSAGIIAGQHLAISGDLLHRDPNGFDVRVGNSSCLVDEEDNQPADSAASRSNDEGLIDSDHFLRCELPETVAGPANLSMRVDCPDWRGCGTPLYTRAAYSVDVDGNKYHTKVIPTISSVSTQASSPAGGALVTIQGSGFHAGWPHAHKLMLGGMPCAVRSVAEDQLVCETAAPDGSRVATARIAEAGVQMAPGGRGLIARKYYGTSLPGSSQQCIAANNLLTLTQEPDQQAVLQTGFQIMQSENQYTERTTSYAESVTGYFVPPVTGQYQFAVKADDRIRLLWGSEADPMNASTLQCVAHNTDYNRLGYWEEASQWTSVRTFNAGEPVLVSMQMMQGSGSGFGRVGARLLNFANTGLQNADGKDVDVLTLQQSAGVRPRQVLRVHTPALRQKYELRFSGANVSETTFGLREAGAPCDGDERGNCPWASLGLSSSDYGTIRNAVRYITGCNSVSVGHNKDRVKGPVQGETTAQAQARLNAYGVTWTIQLNCPRPAQGWPSLSIAHRVRGIAREGSVRGTFSSEVAVTQSASAPLGGVYSLTIAGQSTGPIPITSSWSTTSRNLRDALQALPGLDTVHVSAGSRSSGNCLDDCAFTVMVEDGPSTLAAMTVDVSQLTGYQATTGVTVVDAGDRSTLHFDPAPADWFRTAQPLDSGAQEPVLLSVAGTVATCSAPASQCAFEYLAAGSTPTVSAATGTPATGGDVLVEITGAGLRPAGAALPEVVLGSTGAQCEDVAVATAEGVDTVTCVVRTAPSGSWPLRVRVDGVGWALLAGGAVSDSLPSVSVPLVLNSVTPNTGSVVGGTKITLSGQGFHADGSDVTVGTRPCHSVQVQDANTATCVTAPEAPARRALAADPFNVYVAVPGSGNTTGATFHYAEAATPEVSAVSPTSVSYAVTTTMTLTMGGSWTSADLLNLDMRVGTGSTERRCINARAGVNPGTVECDLLRGPAPAAADQTSTEPLRVHVAGQGNARLSGTASAGLDAKFRVTAVSAGAPGLRGSLLGGQELVFTVEGFVADAVDISDAYVEVPGWDRLHHRIACDITAVSSTQVKCVTRAVRWPQHPPNVPRDAASGELTLRLNRLVAPCLGSCDFTFSAATGLSATAEQTEGNTISATLSGVPEGSVRAWVAGVPCPGSVTAQSFECAQPALPAGEHALTLSTARGLVNITAGYTVVAPLQIEALPYDTVCRYGGAVVRMTGRGFSNITDGNRIEFNGRRATIVSSAADAVVFLMPYMSSGANPMSLRVRVLNAQTRLLAGDVTMASGVTYTSNNAPWFNSDPVTVNGAAGEALQLTGVHLSNGTSFGSAVLVAGLPATVVSWTPTAISVSLPALPAGVHDVTVRVGDYGHAVADNMITVAAAQLALAGAHADGVSIAGGAEVSLTAAGSASLPAITTLPVPARPLGGSAEPVACGAQPASVRVCGKPAEVLTSSGSAMTVRLPWVLPASALSVASDAFEPGSLEGVEQEAGTVAAFDGDVSVAVQQSRVTVGDACQMTIDLGASRRAAVSRIRWYSIWKQANRAIGAVFEASTDGNAWHQLGTVKGRPVESWNYQDITPANAGAEDWEGAAKWRFLRWRGATPKGCAVTELDWIGYAVDVVPANGRCAVEVQSPCADADGALPAYTVTGDVAYTVAGTPRVTSVEPAYGSSNGGDTITVRGTGFKASPAVTLAGGECTSVSVATDGNSLTCVTSPRPGFLPPTVSVRVASVGSAVVNAEVAWRYLDRWSSLNTWKWLEPPVEGDLVSIPEGQSILFDVSIKLTTLIIEGELIWERVDGHHLEAKHILVHGGRFEIGTPETPFTNTATITLHGDRYKDIELPRIGTKVLAVMERGARKTDGTGAQRASQGPYTGRAVSEFNRAVLDIHGIQRARVWTRIAEDAGPGATSMVMSEDVDWAAGDQLVIASSDVQWNHAEVVTVTGVAQASADRPGTWREVTFTPPLKYLHRAQLFDATEYGHGIVDMRAEVGLLSRNIVIQGDKNSAAQRFGAHTMAAGGGTYRLENAEVRNCGQSFILGRYCTHAHMAGEFSRSYVSAMSVHHSFQRMATIHGVKHYRVQHSVGYDIRGHSVFVEDGAEAFNVIENNLVIGTKPCSACIASDTKPASFWAASPKQIWRHNVAAGSVNDGYWHELPGNPHGPSYTTEICPVHEHLGEFFNNTAHSNGVQGLRLYPKVQPFIDPCGAAAGAPQFYRNFTAYRCGKHGIFGKKNGDVHHYGARLLENNGDDANWKILLEDVPYRPHSKPIWDGWGPTPTLGTVAIPQYYASLFVGTTRENFNPATDKLGKSGLFMPQNERFYGAQLTFVNYGQGGALSACAACNSQQFMKQGGYTFRLSGLRFVNSDVRVRWTAPFKQIFYDVDGSLTNQGAGSWAVPYYKFNQHAACTQHEAGQQFGGGNRAGMVCGPTVGVRRLSVDKIEPGWKLDRKGMAFSHTDRAAGVDEADTTDGIAWRPRETWGWAVPLVTVPGSGRYYNAWWYAHTPDVPHPTDWEEARLDWSYEPLLNETALADEWLGLRFNWTYRRYSVASRYESPNDGVTLVRTRGEPVADPVLASQRPGAHDVLGTGWVDRWWDPTEQYTNNTYFIAMTRKFDSLSGGQNPDITKANRVKLTRIQCAPGECRGPRPGIPRTALRWSAPATWTAMGMSGPPAQGDDFTVPDWVELVLDVQPAALRHVRVEGALVFDPSKYLTLRVAAIAVWGELVMGTEDMPIAGRAELLVTGRWADDALIVGEGVDSDTKGVIVLGNFTTFGSAKLSSAKLSASAPAGARELQFDQNMLMWRAGDKLLLPPGQGQAPGTWQIVTVAGSRDPTRAGLVPIEEPLEAAHEIFTIAPGSGAADAPSATVRPVVSLLTNNVIVRGSAEAGDYVYKKAAPGPEGAAQGGSEAGFGVHITVGDPLVKYTDSTGAEVQYRYTGKLDLRHTTIQHAGWAGAEHPAVYLRYRNGEAPANKLDHVSFWGLENRGVRVLNSANLTVRHCVFHASEDFGIEIPDEHSPGAVLDDNVFVGMKRAPDATDMWHNPSAMLYTRSVVKSMAGNTLHGSLDTGIVFVPRACNAADVATAITANAVHGALVGAWPLSLERGPNCVDVRSWTITGARHVALLTVDQTAEVHARDLVVADSHIGVHLGLFRSARRTYLQVHSSTFVATLGDASRSALCSGGPLCNAIAQDDTYGTGSRCQSGAGLAGLWRVGIMAPQLTNRARTCGLDHEDIKPEDCYPYNTVSRLCSLPYDRRYGLPSTRHAELHVRDVAFVGFKARTCAGTGRASGDASGASAGFRSAAYAGNPYQPDFAPPVHMSRISWTDTEDEARFWIHATSATPDCKGGCDAFNQALVRDLDGSALAIDGATSGDPGLLVTHPAIFAQQPAVSCDDSLTTAWGGAACRAKVSGSGAGRLVAGITENIDRDRGHRRIGPMDSRLPSQKEAFPAHGPGDDMCAMRFFFGQYPQLWHAGHEVIMNVTATLPSRFRLHYFSEDAADATRLALWVRRPFDLLVYHGGKQSSQVTTINTASALAANLPSLSDNAGKLLFSPQHLTAWVILRGSAGSPAFTIAQQPSIRLSMTLAVNPEEFFGANLITNLAILLDLDENRIKIADVTAGSTRVMVVITSDPAGLEVPQDDVDNTVVDANGAAVLTNSANDTHLVALNDMYLLASQIQYARDTGELDEAIGYEILAMEIEKTSDGREGLPQDDGVGSDSSESNDLAVAILTASVVGVVIIVMGVALKRRLATAQARRVLLFETGASGSAGQEVRELITNPVGRPDLALSTLPAVAATDTETGRRGSSKTTWAPTRARAAKPNTGTTSTRKMRMVQNHRGEFIQSPV